MPAPPVSLRPGEAQSATGFLTTALTRPAGLVLEGEPGIGKTTRWLSIIDQARGCGFTVLSARAAQAESVLAYGSLADLLSTADAAAFERLPVPQRRALDWVLLRASADGAATDRRTVGAGFLSVVDVLARVAPVLIAIDDLQWLDRPSRNVVAFAARRIAAPVGVLGTVRTEPDGGSPASWLQLPGPDDIVRMRLRPMPIGVLRAVLSQRLNRLFSRRAMVRIHEVSGGNPFYALELARALDDDTIGLDAPLPSTLAELVRARIDELDTAAREALLVVSSVAAPTVELVARATDTTAERVAATLGDAENRAIIAVDGHRLRFAHPLLARGVYTDAAPTQRRALHRRLAEIVDEPELRARHLALAATSGDPVTLQSLDDAAALARQRGAPEAAAELVELAVALGGDTPERRIVSATHYMDAGDPGRARAVLEQTIDGLGAGPLRASALCLLATVRIFGDSFTEAAGLLERGLGETGEDLALRVRMLVALAFARFNSGQLAAAVTSAEDAVADATRLGHPHLLSLALSMRVMLQFLRGHGFDATSMQRALDMEDHDVAVPSAFRPSVQNGLLLSCTGQLERAHREMHAMRRRYLEQGEEGELIFIDFHTILLDVWRGDFTEAGALADDLMERALQLGGDLPLCVGLMSRAAIAAYAGRVDQGRRFTV